MPTNQHRVTSFKCGAKRFEKYMYVNKDRLQRQKRYGHHCLYASFEHQFCNGVRLLQLTDTLGINIQNIILMKRQREFDKKYRTIKKVNLLGFESYEYHERDNLQNPLGCGVIVTPAT